MRAMLISPYNRIDATGLRILSACLKQAGIQTRMLFLPDVEEAMGMKDFDARLASKKLIQQIIDLCSDVDLVGISVMTASFFIARQLTQAIRSTLDIPVIWGDIHATVRPEECLSYANLVCIGDGERTLVELAQRIANGDPYHDLNNLAYLDQQERLVVNLPYPLEQNLDALPFPDYEFEQHYIAHKGSVIPCTENLVYYYLTDLGAWARGPVYSILTTRGCPYKCTYCANNALANLYPNWCNLRRRSVANVIAEIQAVRSRLPGIEAVNIRDDTFLASPKPYIAEFSKRYKEDVDLPFRAYTTAQTADPEKLQNLVDAGLRLAIMGIQSGSADMQKLYQRKVTNEQILRAAFLIHSLKAWIPRPIYDVITDNPYETHENRFDTLQLIHQLQPPYRLSLYSLRFFPGTELYEKAKGDGLIKEEDRSAYKHSIEKVQPNYYNFALVCHSQNLPRPILYLLSKKLIFNLMSLQPMSRASGWLLERFLALRLAYNKKSDASRSTLWLSEDGKSERV